MVVTSHNMRLSAGFDRRAGGIVPKSLQADFMSHFLPSVCLYINVIPYLKVPPLLFKTVPRQMTSDPRRQGELISVIAVQQQSHAYCLAQYLVFFHVFLCSPVT